AEVDTNGSNLAATLENGQPIPIDNVSCDPVARTMQVWVQWPNVSSLSGVPIYLQATSGAVANDPSCWTNAGYDRVYSMDDTSGPIVDRSGNADAALVNGPTLGVDGQIGKGVDFEQSLNQRLTATDPRGVSFTVSGWFIWRSNNANAQQGMITWVSDNGILSGILRNMNAVGDPLQVNVDRGDGEVNYYFGPSFRSPDFGVPYHVAASYSFGSVPQLYVNGNLQTISYGGSFPASTSPTLYISEYNYLGGGRTFDGIIDQVQHAPAAKSAAWIQYEYANQSTATGTMGTVIEDGGDRAVATRVRGRYRHGRYRGRHIKGASQAFA
ncbi:MAG TPA: LamG-like jellyroll fold domain-containing protein, partial [Candidatus Paceibacterota bacterium]|nr:LamG-like jellyroll fold domain-containing protein [Candidatus Paceibacterota bacterium]